MPGACAKCNFYKKQSGLEHAQIDAGELMHPQEVIKKKKSGLEHALIDARELMHVRGAQGGCDTLVYLKDAREFAHSLMLGRRRCSGVRTRI